jgi:hormone-sensitive lipase
MSILFVLIQFCESMRKALQFICIAMASYSEAYYNSGSLLSKATNSVVTGSKYLLDPELRARRIVNIAQYSNVEFCKSFWQLTETGKHFCFIENKCECNNIAFHRPDE